MASFVLQALVALPSLVAASPVVKRGLPVPEPCTGDCQGYVHDPSVVYNGNGTYYRFTTNNEITISTAPSLSGPWTNQGAALPNGSSIPLPGNTDLWAPDVFFYNGLYYMYYSVSTSGSTNSDIGVATSPSMDVGTWTDNGSIGIPPNDNYNRIDANLFQYKEGSPFYLSFGSYWQNIFQVPLNTPPTSVSGDPVHIQYNTTNPGPNGTPDEGGFQFWYNVDGTDYYYLFFSDGNCCGTPQNFSDGNAYKIMVCRSDNPNGGFVDENGVDCLQSGGTLVLAGGGASGINDVYAPGGQGVFYDPNQDSVVIYYHWVNTTVGYNSDQFQFGWNKLDLSSGWPTIVS